MNAEQYAEKIKHTRADIDKTLHTLEDRLSPKELWDQAVKWGEGARDFSVNLGRTVRENPIPAALMGISLIWFMAAGAGRRVERTDVPEIKSRLRDKYAEMKSTLQDTTAGAGDKVKTFSTDIGHRVSADIRNRGEHLREQGQELKQKMQARGSELSARPVLLSALGLAVGALVAMSLPVSRKEKEILGERGREMYRWTSEAVGKQVERGREAAEAAKEKFMGEEEHQGSGAEWAATTERSPDDFRHSTH